MSRTPRKPSPNALTASEAAFEAVLASIDAPAPPARTSLAPSPRSTDEEAFVDALYAQRETRLADDRYRNIDQSAGFNTKIVGVSFEGRQDIVAGLSEGLTLELRRQRDNPHDPHAVAVHYGALQIGFFKRDLALRLAPLMDGGVSYRASIKHITGGGAKNAGVNIWVERVDDVRERTRPATAGGVDERTILRALVGAAPLRAAQRDVLANLERGRRTLAIMGTGRGKSLCFQFPAAREGLASGKKTVVIYPLRALANDQYTALERRLAPLGLIVLRANGSISDDERAELMASLEDGSWHVILATPEFLRFHVDKFARPHNFPHLIVVDECHHVFESRNRAAYANLPDTLRRLGSPQLLALTATANDATFEFLQRTLDLDAWVIDPHVRENLQVIDARGTSDKVAYIERLIEKPGKALVYCTSRSETGSVAEKLRRRFGNEIAFYHGGMGSSERMQVEGMFRDGKLRVVIATSAFGEGIDLPDVRAVVLYHLNFDLTEFNQQAGRAGRDGAPAEIHLLYGQKDRRINEYIIACDAPSIGTLRAIYRGLREMATDNVLQSNNEAIARTLDIDMVEPRTIGIALHIFVETGLIRTERSDEGSFIELLEVSDKVDLERNERFAEGEAERASFERFAKIALELEAATLQALINRPIYPRDAASTPI